jgi:DNA-binding beta-propeller fold protein YncE
MPESHPIVLDGTFEKSLLATVWKGSPEGTVLFPLDPATGTALPGYAPIPLGQSSFHAFSHDRRTLAVVTFPDQNASKGSLVLVDLTTWTTKRFEIKLSGWVSTMLFSPDGKRLAIFHGDSRYKLTMIEVQRGLITAQRNLDSFLSRLMFTKSGDGLMLYNSTVHPIDQWKAGPPQVQLLDAIDLSTRWSVELNNVHDGIYPKDDRVTSANIYEPGQALYISPGLAFAPDRDVLYIVHADSEQLTRVDFDSQKVETVEIQRRLGWFERLLSLTADVAHAKVGDGITRQVVVSPDGRFLYVVGVNSVTFNDQQGNWQMEQTPLGLEIIETRDGRLVEQRETEATEVSISPDGRFLYLRNWGSHTGNIPWTDTVDIASQELVAHKDKVFANPVLLMNGEFLLASTYSTSETSHHMTTLQPDGLTVLSEWTDDEYVYWLSVP